MNQFLLLCTFSMFLQLLFSVATTQSLLPVCDRPAPSKIRLLLRASLLHPEFVHSLRLKGITAQLLDCVLYVILQEKHLVTFKSTTVYSICELKTNNKLRRKLILSKFPGSWQSAQILSMYTLGGKSTSCLPWTRKIYKNTNIVPTSFLLRPRLTIARQYL
jgi:hypothetical protein